MRNKFIAGGVILLCLGVAGVFLWQRAAPEAQYPIKRIVRYSFTVQNTTNRFLEKATFSTYAPVKQTSIQETTRLKSSHNYRLVEDDLGNQILHFDIENFPPYGSKTITVEAELAIAEQPTAISAKKTARARFLGSEEYIETEHPRVVKAAKRLGGTSGEETAQKIYRWVVNNIKDTGFVKADRGALYALDKRRGDCTEYAYLFAALARINDLPTRAMAGYVYGENAILKPRDYHNWAEVYLDGAWRVVDPQKRSFMNNQSHYIAMRIISSKARGQKGIDSQRLTLPGRHITVAMNK